MRLSRVDGRRPRPPRRKITCALHFMPGPRDSRSVFYRLAIVSRLSLDIEVPLAHYIRGQTESARNAIEDILDHHHTLRAAEPPKSRLRCLVGLAHVSCQIAGREKIAVVHMKQRPPQNRLR